MIRKAVAISLLVVVLGCPLISLWQAWGAVPVANGCCAGPCAESANGAGTCSDDPPPDHDPKNCTKNCLCGGAIVQRTSEKAGWQAELPALPPVATAAGRLIVATHCDTAFSAEAPDSLFPLSGRQTLALIECLRL